MIHNPLAVPRTTRPSRTAPSWVPAGCPRRALHSNPASPAGSPDVTTSGHATACLSPPRGSWFLLLQPQRDAHSSVHRLSTNSQLHEHQRCPVKCMHGSFFFFSVKKQAQTPASSIRLTQVHKTSSQQCATAGGGDLFPEMSKCPVDAEGVRTGSDPRPPCCSLYNGSPPAHVPCGLSWAGVGPSSPRGPGTGGGSITIYSVFA